MDPYATKVKEIVERYGYTIAMVAEQKRFNALQQ